MLSILIFFFICIPPVRFTVPATLLLPIPEDEPNPKPIEVTPSLLANAPEEEVEEEDEEDEEDEEEEEEEEEEVAACSAFSRV